MLYKVFSRGAQSPLADLTIQYADFAVWQREWLTGEVVESQLAYWKQQLGGVLPTLDMQTDRPRPVMLSHRGGRQGFKLDKETSNAVRTLSRKEGVTVFMTLLAAFDVLLFCRTGQTDIIVGTDVANRNRGEIEGLIGFFINQLALRIDNSGDPTFQELLERIREVALGAYNHQDLPFDKLIEALKPGRSTVQTPLFQIKMIFQNIPELSHSDIPVGEDRLVSRPLEFDLSGTSEHDMNLILRDTPDGISGSIKYSADLFFEATIAQLLADLRAILEMVTANPDIRLSETVKVINEAHSRDLINKRNQLTDFMRRGLKGSETKPVRSRKMPGGGSYEGVGS